MGGHALDPAALSTRFARTARLAARAGKITRVGRCRPIRVRATGVALALGLVVPLGAGACGGSAKVAGSATRAGTATTTASAPTSTATTPASAPVSTTAKRTRRAAKPAPRTHKPAKRPTPAPGRTTTRSTSTPTTSTTPKTAPPAKKKKEAPPPPPFVGPMRATLVGESHAPIANRPWTYAVTATDSRGRALAGTVETEFALGGSVVGKETPPVHRLVAGRLSDVITFPSQAVGVPLEVQVVVHTQLGTVTLDWAVKVRR